MPNIYDLFFDINDIKSKKTLADQKFDELSKSVVEFKKMIEETKMIYDTPSSKKYYVVAEHYLDIVISYLDNILKPYINKLDNIINSYNELYHLTSTYVGKGDSDEV